MSCPHSRAILAHEWLEVDFSEQLFLFSVKPLVVPEICRRGVQIITLGAGSFLFILLFPFPPTFYSLLTALYFSSPSLEILFIYFFFAFSVLYNTLLILWVLHRLEVELQRIIHLVPQTVPIKY